MQSLPAQYSLLRFRLIQFALIFKNLIDAEFEFACKQRAENDSAHRIRIAARLVAAVPSRFTRARARDCVERVNISVNIPLAYFTAFPCQECQIDRPVASTRRRRRPSSHFIVQPHDAHHTRTHTCAHRLLVNMSASSAPASSSALASSSAPAAWSSALDGPPSSPSSFDSSESLTPSVHMTRTARSDHIIVTLRAAGMSWSNIEVELAREASGKRMSAGEIERRFETLRRGTTRMPYHKPKPSPLTMDREYHTWNFAHLMFIDKKLPRRVRVAVEMDVVGAQPMLKPVAKASWDYVKRAMAMHAWITRMQALKKKPNLRKCAEKGTQCPCDFGFAVDVPDVKTNEIGYSLDSTAVKCELGGQLRLFSLTDLTRKVLMEWHLMYNSDYEDNYAGFNPY
jgi:hypothetical protein